MAEYKSKHGSISKPPFEMYMSFVDMRNFVQMLPEDKKGSVNADFDTLEATVQGFTIGIKVADRVPYSRIDYTDNGNAPFKFRITLFFDPDSYNPGKTDFHIEVEAELNMMMRMMLGSKIQEGLDKIVESLETNSKL